MYAGSDGRTVRSAVIGTVLFTRARAATAVDCWVDLTLPSPIGIHDLVVIDSPPQQLVGRVTDMRAYTPPPKVGQPEPMIRPPAHTVLAKVTFLGSSDGRERPPDGSRVRLPTPDDVTMLVGDARRIPVSRQVPVGVVALPAGFAPIMIDSARLTGPIATSQLISGSAGSLKSTAGVLLALSLQRVLAGQIGLVIINSKGSDFSFADYGRERLCGRFGWTSLRARDREIYAALGFAAPPTLQDTTVFVPEATNPLWRSSRPLGFPRTEPYRLSYAAGLRHALAPTDEDEPLMSGITRQCVEVAAGEFAEEQGITSLAELILALEREYQQMSNERARWRSQFQQKTVAAALRQLMAAERDLGPLLGHIHEQIAFPVERLAAGGTWVIDVSPLPQRAAQAVIDEVVSALWQAKARNSIPHTMPLLLMVDELNRWHANGPTSARLAAITRDQRHRQFGLIGLCQQLSTLNAQMLANVDGFWYGTTRSAELIEECYAHLPQHIRIRLHRLPDGIRLLDTWPLAEPLALEVPYPSWLISDEGLALVEAWTMKQQRSHIEVAHHNGHPAAASYGGGTE